MDLQNLSGLVTEKMRGERIKSQLTSTITNDLTQKSNCMEKWYAPTTVHGTTNPHCISNGKSVYKAVGDNNDVEGGNSEGNFHYLQPYLSNCKIY